MNNSNDNNQNDSNNINAHTDGSEMAATMTVLNNEQVPSTAPSSLCVASLSDEWPSLLSIKQADDNLKRHLCLVVYGVPSEWTHLFLRLVLEKIIHEHRANAYMNIVQDFTNGSGRIVRANNPDIPPVAQVWKAVGQTFATVGCSHREFALRLLSLRKVDIRPHKTTTLTFDCWRPKALSGWTIPQSMGGLPMEIDISDLDAMMVSAASSHQQANHQSLHPNSMQHQNINNNSNNNSMMTHNLHISNKVAVGKQQSSAMINFHHNHNSNNHTHSNNLTDGNASPTSLTRILQGESTRARAVSPFDSHNHNSHNNNNNNSGNTNNYNPLIDSSNLKNFNNNSHTLQEESFSHFKKQQQQNHQQNQQIQQSQFQFYQQQHEQMDGCDAYLQQNLQQHYQPHSHAHNNHQQSQRHNQPNHQHHQQQQNEIFSPSISNQSYFHPSINNNNSHSKNHNISNNSNSNNNPNNKTNNKRRFDPKNQSQSHQNFASSAAPRWQGTSSSRDQQQLQHVASPQHFNLNYPGSSHMGGGSSKSHRPPPPPQVE
eukprot:GDKJ01026495.1.p1 GENE.GDKJ01026495.1~~GDKJ01026495.1.p1  ORF type:complete len:561 (+),score=173.33 GDKJ01026495.1:59-1684(+)